MTETCSVRECGNDAAVRVLHRKTDEPTHPDWKYLCPSHLQENRAAIQDEFYFHSLGRAG